jgi:hypothetical protein
MFDSLSKSLGMRSRSVSGNKIRAIVVDNKDPEKRGRIKARGRDIHDNFPDDHLPLAMPGHGFGAGAKNLGEVDVPPIGSVVFLTHQDNSLYHPQYTKGPSTDDKKVKGLTDDDYPHVVGNRDRAGNISSNNYKPKEDSSSKGEAKSVNATASDGGQSGGQEKDKNEIFRKHATGTEALVDTDGNVVIKTVKQVKISINGPCTILVKEDCKINTQGNAEIICDKTAKIYAKSEVDIRGGTVNINKGAPSSATAPDKTTTEEKPKLDSPAGKEKY